MTQAELSYYTQVPHALRDIANELKEIKEQLKQLNEKSNV